MKTKLLIAFIAMLALAHVARAQSTAFTYQGRVTDNGTNFTGSGQFKFALVTSTNTQSQATATAISAALFTQPNLQLRIWFNDGVNGFSVLSPVQNLTPTPYAVQALNATTASNLSGTQPLKVKRENQMNLKR